jgi:hypothetical protein
MPTPVAAEAPSSPRIAPGGPAEIGRLNHALARLIGAATGAGRRTS